MAWLEPEEIVPGIVIHMDHQMLVGDPNVRRTGSQDFQLGQAIKPRTLVCIAVDGDRCWWAPTSTTPSSAKYQRLELKSMWRSGGDPQWTSEDQYLLDGADLLEGPATSFCRASYGERTDSAGRARL